MKIKQLIRLNIYGINLLKSIKEDILSKEDTICPNWNTHIISGHLGVDNNILTLENTKNMSDCKICGILFPKCNDIKSSCPCGMYTSKYLVRRLDEIIAFNEKEG